MKPEPAEKNRRVLVIDDNRDIHDGFRKILQPGPQAEVMAQAKAELFGPGSEASALATFTVDSAYQGCEGLEKVREAAAAGRPYAMAFVDMRMPPGWDGLETTLKLWEAEPDLQIVICTAYADFSWRDLIARIGLSDRLVVLKKPFDNLDVLQLSLALTEKWRLLQQSRLELETLQRAVEARTAELQAENAARRRAQEEAQHARAAAEAADRSKSSFLANMSHEIRTPMNGIVGMANLLLQTELSGEQRDFAETLRTSSEALLGILNDILDFSKIEAGRLDLETTDFNLWEVVESTIDLHATRASQKGLELISQIGDDVPSRVRGDPLRLRQVLLNLVGNAVKFTERGEVFLNASVIRQHETSAEVRFEIRDTGVGIPADALPRLFQAFSQADDSTTRRFGGTGLGLAISRRLVEAMQGTISVRSEPGCGSTFVFAIPLLKQAGEQTPAAVDRIDLRGVRALVVDDNETNRKVLHHQLDRWGVVNAAAASAPAALELLRNAPAAYDLVLLDMQMPHMDGLMLADAIRQIPTLNGLRLVMLTSMGERLDSSVRAAHGLADCLNKPVKQSQLFRSLATAMSGTRSSASPIAPAVRPREPRPPAALPVVPCVRTTDSAYILIAEDNPVSQKVAQLQLKQLGFAADVVADGADVLPALQKKRYEIIFMDCQMARVDGFQATQQIRQAEIAGKTAWKAPVHVIAMTANAMQGDREKCFTAGMNDYVTKPVDISEMESALTRHFEGKAAGAAAPKGLLAVA
jgi:signal transduction histidine kinase/two-component SAPR family response regulator